MAQLALFDFDKTLVKRDTFLDFALFYLGTLGFVRIAPAMLLLWVAFKIKLLDRDKAKEKVFTLLFRGREAKSVQAAGNIYLQRRLLHLTNEPALETLKLHQTQGATVAVVSASMDIWLRPWCMLHGVELICTESEIKDGRFTGRFSTRNCNYDEKLNRVRDRFDLAAYSSIHVYGDSAGDEAMMTVATHAFYQSFPRSY